MIEYSAFLSQTVMEATVFTVFYEADVVAKYVCIKKNL